MKKLQKLKLKEHQELDCTQMQRISGGYDWGGPVIYHAIAVNYSGSTAHFFSDTSERLVLAWGAAWQAAGWSVSIREEYRIEEPAYHYA